MSKMFYNQLSVKKNFAGYYPKKFLHLLVERLYYIFEKELHFAITRKMEPKRNFAKGRG